MRSDILGGIYLVAGIVGYYALVALLMIEPKP